jgi:hypothetical protein
MDAYSSWIVRLGRRIRHAALEFHRATKLASELRFSYGLIETNQPPETYAEFQLRTSASSVHEPPARSRAAGQQVR